MPPRYAYWTIVIDGGPTAFRAATRDELLPTLRQIQRKTPSAVMKWFSRGRVWESPAEATAALRESAARHRTAHAGRSQPGGTQAGSSHTGRSQPGQAGSGHAGRGHAGGRHAAPPRNGARAGHGTERPPKRGRGR